MSGEEIPPEVEEQEDPVEDALWAARTGDLDLLKSSLAQVPYESCRDPQSGSTPLHMACANGHAACVQYLLEEVKADQSVTNLSGSTALHWAVQNNQSEAARLLCAKPEADVLKRNAQGKSSTTLAHERGNTEIVQILLEHTSAAALEAGRTEEEVANDESGGGGEEGDLQKHDSVYSFIKSDAEPHPSFTIREVGMRPKTLEELAEGDATRTHFTVWAASVILARWIAREPTLIQGKSVIELGAGCGLPGVAAYRCCKPKRVMLTDLEVRSHLEFNVRCAKKKVLKAMSKSGQEIPPIQVSAIDWTKTETWPSEWLGSTDILLGSDLVYDKELVQPLVDSCTAFATPETGMMLYVSANSDRAGMDDFLKAMKPSFVLESKRTAPRDLLKNPLGEDKAELFELHLSELRDVEHTLYVFRRRKQL